MTATYSSDRSTGLPDDRARSPLPVTALEERGFSVEVGDILSPQTSRTGVRCQP